MQLGTLKTLLRSFINYSEVDDVLLLQFINIAKKNIERSQVWESARRERSDLTYSTGGMTLPANFREFPHNHSVAVIGTNGGIIPLIGSASTTEDRRGWSDRQFFGDNAILPETVARTSETRYYLKIQFDESTRKESYLLITTPELLDGQAMQLDYYLWLSDYVNDDEEDFFLRVGADALLWDSIKTANKFLNEESRVKVDLPLYLAALQQLIDHNSRILFSAGGIEL